MAAGTWVTPLREQFNEPPGVLWATWNLRRWREAEQEKADVNKWLDDLENVLVAGACRPVP